MTSERSGAWVTTMSDDGSLSRAFILHVRKFRDTSVIIELMTETEGRLSAVMRGVRTRKSKTASHVRPFTQVLVSWFGRGELKTIRTMDFPVRAAVLTGEALVTGLYVNELLVRLTGKFEPLPAVFDAYGTMLSDLESGNDIQPLLRRFELTLLGELGYGVTFDVDADTGDPVEPGVRYGYTAGTGFYRLPGGVAEPGVSPPGYSGDVLLALARGAFDEPDALRAAKRIVRVSINELLGGRELKSRELLSRREERA